MTKVDIFSGFLGAGKTTLIKKLIDEVYKGQKLVLIENEFGEIGIDGGFLQDAGINITEMNSGCICCSLVGDFGEALKKVMEQFSPDRILIEPSGVGKLSDVIRAVQGLNIPGLELNSFTTVVDASKCKMYMKNFGEFFNNQIEHANSIVLSRTGSIKDQRLAEVVALLREHNGTATIITTPWDQIEGAQILEAMEHRNTLEKELELLRREQEEDDDDDDDECGCGHHHHHDDEHEHHHHDGGCCHHHGDDDDEHEHHHHDGECCHHNDDDDEHEHHHHEGECCHHHHHHDADEVFTSWGVETAGKYTAEEISDILKALDGGEYGQILRAKGIVAGQDGKWLHFDFVPGEVDVRQGCAAVMGRLCVIGSKLSESALSELFRV